MCSKRICTHLLCVLSIEWFAPHAQPEKVSTLYLWLVQSYISACLQPQKMPKKSKNYKSPKKSKNQKSNSKKKICFVCLLQSIFTLSILLSISYNPIVILHAHYALHTCSYDTNCHYYCLAILPHWCTSNGYEQTIQLTSAAIHTYLHTVHSHYIHRRPTKCGPVFPDFPKEVQR